MEKEAKIKKEKAPKTKKSKYPEGYIGRPKPMKTKSFEFHKPTVKTWIGLGILLLFVAFVTYIVFRLIQVSNVHDPDFAFYEFKEDASKSNYVLENNYLKFEMDPLTTQFTVTQKENGHVWYSNPSDCQSDKIALVKEKNNMMSTILVKYSTENGVDEIYDTYTNSVKRNFYSIEKKNSGITVNYTIGQMDREYIFPLAIYEDDLLMFEEKMTKSQINAVNRAFHKYSMDSFKTQDEEDSMLEKYPGLEDQPLYLVFENIQNFLKVQMEQYFGAAGYTYEDYQKSKELYKEVNIKEVPAFNVSVTYKLDGNNMIVDIPFEDISYKHKYPITQLSVLPYFAAGGVSDEGFMLVPEGGGAIINFNNGKTKQNGYYADVYGWDSATDRKALITETRTAYPVFGISSGDSSVISIIEEGAPYAGITAEIAGKLGSYNYVRSDYKMLHREQFDVSSRNTSAQFSYEPTLPKGEKIKQVYSFVNSSSYVDMAKSYQKYLFGKQKKVSNTEAPVAVELIGAIDKVQQVAGMPKNKAYELTTYAEAADIINEVENLGLKNVNYKLSGFINDGIRQKMLNKVKYTKALGGKSGFNKMLKNVSSTSAKLYLDATVQTVYRSGIFEGFNKYSDAARFVSDEICELSEFSPVWYGKLDTVDTYYLLRPELAVKGSNLLVKNAVKNKLFGVSYRDNGYTLSADYNDNNIVTRGTSMKMQQESLANAKENGLGVMINAGNDYVLKNVDFITNMKLHGNQYAILDKQVPFYQIALHGYVNYAGSPINLGYEKDQIILESAETGAGLYFTFMSASERKIQETFYTEYYAACFETWKSQFDEICKRYNKEVGVVKNSTIVDHAYESDQVTCTKFDNGYAVYVNFGYVDYTNEDGMSVSARDYKVVKVEG